MNKNELIYDLKEHLDMFSQTYDNYNMTYNQADRLYEYIKELQQANNLTKGIDELIKKYEDNIIECNRVIQAHQYNEMTRDLHRCIKKCCNEIIQDLKKLKGE